MPSTAIRTIAYETATHQLWVTFVTGRRYVYENVAPRTAYAFQRAPSRGAFFNHEIRDRYAYREVTQAHQRRAS